MGLVLVLPLIEVPELWAKGATPQKAAYFLPESKQVKFLVVINKLTANTGPTPGIDRIRSLFF